MSADHLNATEAADFLGVQKATLYAYAARGLLTSMSVPGQRQKAYARSELSRHKLRIEARSGHTAAAAALRPGAPEFNTGITVIDPRRGPLYHGHAAIDLARQGTTFEATALLLWTGRLPQEARPDFRQQPDKTDKPDAFDPRRLVGLVEHGQLMAALEAVVFLLRRQAPGFEGPRELELRRARAIVRHLAASFALSTDSRRHHYAAWRDDGIAVAVAYALTSREPAADAVVAIERALVVIADHGLNPSTFAARVAASTGADLTACLQAGLATLSGPRHGGACDRIEALLDVIGTPARAVGIVQERLRQGESVPGFSPEGDPRAAVLLELPRVATSEGAGTARALIDAMQNVLGTDNAAPSVELALVAMCRAFELPPGAASALFALGRSAGWIAHVLEQRAVDSHEHQARRA